MIPRLATLLLMMTALVRAAAAEPPLHGWQLLAPLPDPVGYGGMFAGVLGGRLVAGGGAQFHDRPNWLQGEKKFSDRLFVLADPTAAWVEEEVRLPAPVAYAASAATGDSICVVGGVNAAGCLAHAMQIRADGEKLRFAPLPDFPHPIGNAAAAIARGRMYVFGGVTDPASKTPSIETWSLDLADSPTRAWRREPDCPDAGVFVGAAGSDGDSIYAFGGIGFDATGKAIPSARAYRLAPEAKAWQRLADLPEARVGPATPCPQVAGGKFLVIGGYAEVFPGAARDHPGFSDQTLLYDPRPNTWANGALLPRAPVPNRDSPGDPGPAPMLAAPCAIWRDLVVVISGEVRASVRSPAVLAWPLNRIQP